MLAGHCIRSFVLLILLLSTTVNSYANSCVDSLELGSTKNREAISAGLDLVGIFYGCLFTDSSAEQCTKIFLDLSSYPMTTKDQKQPQVQYWEYLKKIKIFSLRHAMNHVRHYSRQLFSLNHKKWFLIIIFAIIKI